MMPIKVMPIWTAERKRPGSAASANRPLRRMRATMMSSSVTVFARPEGRVSATPCLSEGPIYNGHCRYVQCVRVVTPGGIGGFHQLRDCTEHPIEPKAAPHPG